MIIQKVLNSTEGHAAFTTLKSQATLQKCTWVAFSKF